MGGRGRAGHSLCSNSLFNAFVKTQSGVCPTPISSLVAKGHAQSCSAHPKSVFLFMQSMTNWVFAFLRGGKAIANEVLSDYGKDQTWINRKRSL
jgi:hypothetical protein